MIIIREITELDFDQVLNCIRRAVDISNRPDYPTKIIEYQLTKHYIPEWIKNTHEDKYFVVALLNQKIVGTGALKENEVRSMFIDPDYQQKGIGRTIIDHLEEYAFNHGYRTIVLDSSITGINFYEKLGYTKNKDEIVEWLGEKVRSVSMIKHLETKN